MKFWKEMWEYRKKLAEEERLRKRLVKSQLDYGALQVMVDRAEDNPNLRIEITLAGGTKMVICSKKNNKRTLVSDYINGEDDYL